jgi:hypothetical protein
MVSAYFCKKILSEYVFKLVNIIVTIAIEEEMRELPNVMAILVCVQAM